MWSNQTVFHPVGSKGAVACVVSAGARFPRPPPRPPPALSRPARPPPPCARPIDGTASRETPSARKSSRRERRPSSNSRNNRSITLFIESSRWGRDHGGGESRSPRQKLAHRRGIGNIPPAACPVSRGFTQL